MFELITQALIHALAPLRSRPQLTHKEIAVGVDAIREAWSAAGVFDAVAQTFADRVIDATICRQVANSLDPRRQLIRILYEELIKLIGPGGPSKHPGGDDGMQVIMLCGLRGSGKTTTCGKLARRLMAAGRQPMLVAADLRHRAASEQLRAFGGQLQVPVYSENPQNNSAVHVCRNGWEAAQAAGNIETLILDTSGQPHLNAEWLSGLTQIKNAFTAPQILFVCDATTGQHGVAVAKSVDEALKLHGVILAKLDCDDRGAAMLSMRRVTGLPIQYVGVGERLDQLQEFHPDRMAERILGMGDMRSLVEEAKAKIDQLEMQVAEAKMREGEYTLDTFLSTMKQMKKLGSMQEIMKMIPGMGGALEAIGDFNPDDDMKHVEGMIQSMTPHERENQDVIDFSRQRRIAAGAGVAPSDVAKLLKDFSGMRRMMTERAGKSTPERLREGRQRGGGAW